MGICGSKEMTPEEKAEAKAAKARTRELEQEMQQDQQRDAQVNKLLLLGAGESGKSTLFKQMISIYGTGFPEEERVQYVSIVHNNIVSSIKTLVEKATELPQEDPQLGQQIGEMDDSAKEAAAAVAQMKMSDRITPAMASTMKLLWESPCIQSTYELRSMYQLTDSTAYFLDQVDQVAAEGYIPSEQDVLRSRVRTTGIVENSFEIEGNPFQMYDVGGQRNERKKWIHCFSDVTAVLFVVAMSAYDQTLFEDESTNRMQEAIQLFGEICGSQWFRKTSMILLLNKSDLFAEKIVRVPLSDFFSEYDGPNTFEDAGSYIEHVFVSQNLQHDRHIYTHWTCATDTDTMRIVFNAVKDTVIRKSLQEGGLIS